MVTSNPKKLARPGGTPARKANAPDGGKARAKVD